jgi:hypothetical protein
MADGSGLLIKVDIGVVNLHSEKVAKEYRGWSKGTVHIRYRVLYGVDILYVLGELFKSRGCSLFNRNLRLKL